MKSSYDGVSYPYDKTIFCTRLYTCFFIAVKFEMLQVLGVTAVFATSTLASFFYLALGF